MLNIIMENFSTIGVSAVVAAVLALVVVKMVHDKKNGRSSCSCGCANCPSKGMCHGK